MATLEELEQQRRAAEKRLREAESWYQTISSLDVSNVRENGLLDYDIPPHLLESRIKAAEKEIQQAQTAFTQIRSDVNAAQKEANKPTATTNVTKQLQDQERQANAAAGKGPYTNKELADI